jgi:hypothetical protein
MCMVTTGYIHEGGRYGWYRYVVVDSRGNEAEGGCVSRAWMVVCTFVYTGDGAGYGII